LDKEVQTEYETQLSSLQESSKVKKFINDVNRSLNGVKLGSIDKQLTHFSNIELPNHSNKSYVFLEAEFGNKLKISTPTMN